MIAMLGFPLRRLRIRGPSMAPTLRDGDVVLVQMTPKAKPGQLALVRWDVRPGQFSVKRAIYAEHELWHVRGDNEFGSTDSRELGPARVLGVVRWRLWPSPGRIGQPVNRSSR